MGIKDLHTLLKKYCPQVYKTKSLKEYAYKKIGIDISLYLYKYKASPNPYIREKYGEYYWIINFLNLVSTLRTYDIHCVFIYDNFEPLPEKIEEQQRRRTQAQKGRDRIKMLEEEIDQYESTGSIGNEIIYIYQKTLSKKNTLLDMDIDDDKNDDKNENIPLDNKIVEWLNNKGLKDVRDKLTKLKMMDIRITREDIDFTKKIFDFLKIPYYTGVDEAERYASQLCVLGKIDGVLTEDTDVLAYGTPIFLSKIDLDKGVVVEIDFNDILKGIDLDYKSFRDLCILLGCDYNNNIYGYGYISAYNLIKKYKNIDEIIKEIDREQGWDEFTPNEKKIKVKGGYGDLNYKRCRELFSIPEKIDLYINYCDVLGEEEFNKFKEFLREVNIYLYTKDEISLMNDKKGVYEVDKMLKGFFCRNIKLKIKKD